MENIVHKVTKRELASFFNSTFYQNLENIPFTSLRLNSYLNNPNSQPNDVILYYIINNNQIISYRTLLHDKLFNDKIIVWSSGNWTHPNHRNKGYSSLLFKEVENDYPQQSIIYTKSIASNKVYQKFNQYRSIIDKDASELHYNFTILDKKFPQIVSKLLNLFFKKSSKKIDLNQIKITSKIANINPILFEKNTEDLFPLTIEKINWITNFPWIATERTNINEETNYDFSLFDSSFKSDFFTINETGFIYRNIRKKEYYIHYIFYKTNEDAIAIAKFIINEFNENNLSTIIVKDLTIKKLIKQLQRPIFSKPHKNFLIYHKNLETVICNKKIQNGVGELIFT